MPYEEFENFRFQLWPENFSNGTNILASKGKQSICSKCGRTIIALGHSFVFSFLLRDINYEYGNNANRKAIHKALIKKLRKESMLTFNDRFCFSPFQALLNCIHTNAAFMFSSLTT